jgi:hypothetical protein
MTLTNDRPVLSSERVTHTDRTETCKQEEISGHEPPDGAWHQDRQTDRQSQYDFDFENQSSRSRKENQELSHS